MTTPKIVLTMGDPAGIGPEVCLAALNDLEIERSCIPILFGDMNVLSRVANRFRIKLPQTCVSADQLTDNTLLHLDSPTIVDFGTAESEKFAPGQINASTGAACYQYIERAIELAMAHKIDAVTTGPINKEAIHAANINYPGHTEIFTEKSGATHSCMMQYSDELTCSFVTTHVGYDQVPKLLTQERITEVIDLSVDVIRRTRKRSPSIVVCGLNPHAGENGLFGNREEENIIQPAIDVAKSKGINIVGPLPPDTCFLPQRRAETDCFICMYHDQGHIPLKALAFDMAVNVTLGLPIIRTSVDHGTALDIAWQNKANPSSIKQAIKLAIKLACTAG